MGMGRTGKWLMAILAMLLWCVAGGLDYGVSEARAETSQDGVWWYELNNDEVTVLGYNGSEEKIVIPDTIDGKKVTGIGSAFSQWGDFDIKSIEIPNSITDIYVGRWDLGALTDIIVRDGSEYYASENGILYNRDLTELLWYPAGKKDSVFVIPDGVERIGNSAFRCCSSLTGIEIPDCVTSIGDRAFYSCNRLLGIKIPDGVTSIGDWAFSSCSGLMSITIPGSVTSFGMNAFYGTPWLDNTIREDGLLVVNTVVADGRKCSGDIIIPNGVTSIGKSAFEYSSVTSVTIPDGVTSIGEYAFKDCTALEDISLPANLECIANGTFSGCSCLKSIEIPDKVTFIGNSAFLDCTSLEEVVLPESLTAIRKDAFGHEVSWGDERTLRVIIPEKLEELNGIGLEKIDYIPNITFYIVKGGKAEEYFSWYREIAVITYEPKTDTLRNGDWEYRVDNDEVTIIKYYGKDAEVVIPKILDGKSVTGIGGEAFLCCFGIKSIEIPDSIMSIDIGGNAFWNCTDLTGFIVEQESAYYTSQDGILYNKDLTELLCCPAGKNGTVVIPDSVTRIGDAAFGCGNLPRIGIPSGVTSIGDRAFYGCIELKAVRIGDGVTRIGNEAFMHCNSLTDIEIPDQVMSMGSGVFGECKDLENIALSVNLERIEEGTFAGCGNLKKIEIPDKVTYIGERAFAYCNLEDVVLPESLERIENETFASCIHLKRIKIPDKVTYIGERAFLACSILEDVILPESLMEISWNVFDGIDTYVPNLKITIPEKLEDISGLGLENMSNIKCILCICVAEGSEAERYLSQYSNITVKTYAPQTPPEGQNPPGNQTSSGEKDPDKSELADKDSGKLSGDAEGQTTQPQKTEVGKIYTVKGLKYKVTSSKNAAFVGVSQKTVTTLKIPAKVTILKQSFQVTAVGKRAMKKCSKLKTVVIGKNVKTIGDEAFMQCGKLNKITFGKNVRTIGKKVLYGDKKLTRIILKGAKITKIGKKTLRGVPKKVKITAPQKAITKYKKLLNEAK